VGSMIYGLAPAIEIEDRALKHLQAVIISKLRRNESFAFNWDNEPDVGQDVTTHQGGAHGSVWISRSSLLYFAYEGDRNVPLNKAWIELLAKEAGSPSGLRLLPEPAPEEVARKKR
jgi:hypothetical protein